MEYSIDVLMQQSFYIIVLQNAFQTQAEGGGGEVSPWITIICMKLVKNY